MSKQSVHSDKAPAAIGPYSQAIKEGRLLFTSGAIPLTTDGAIPEDIGEQAHLALSNLGAVLAAGGASFADVVKVTVFIRDMADFAVINGVYGEYFQQPYPARSCVQVARLPKDVGLEIEAVAVVE
ncbi:MAG: RidA family protein [Bacillota bacterium]|nr:RidA family protein [Bacillota bacterium]